MEGNGFHKPIPAPEWRNVVTGLYEGFQHTFLIMNGVVKAGHIGIQNLSREDRRAEISIAVLPALQNRGIATEALEQVMKLAFNQPADGGLGLQLVLAYVVSENIASQKLFLAENFKLEATIPGYHRINGRRVDRQIYAWGAP